MNDGIARYCEVDLRVTAILLEEAETIRARETLRWRVTLLDLLLGRSMRERARLQLEDALWIEARGWPAGAVDELLDAAAHLEWIATVSERGQVYWGGRLNRDGRRPEDMSP